MITKRKQDPISPSSSSHDTSSSRISKRKKTTDSMPSTSKHVPNPSFTGGEPTAPTEKEWESMTPYQSFIVEAHGKEHRFPGTIKGYALILPEGADPNSSLRLRDFWVGKIKEIRSRNSDPSDVWVSTQWLMSVGDVAKYKKLNTEAFGKMEMILSNHFDFVHTSCFADIANVVEYVESNAMPLAISDETFYYRSKFDIFSHEIEGIPSPTCFCDTVYNPDDSPVMHFCPRKGCCMAFHADCLRRKNYVEKPRKDVDSLRKQRALQFERTLSDSSSDEDQADGEPPVSLASDADVRVTSKQPVRSRDRIRSGSLTGSQPPSDRHKEIPDDLLALARSAMVKGQGTDLPYEWSCVTGNLAVVTRARRLVREVVEGDKDLPNKWYSFLAIPGESDDDVKNATAWAVKDYMFLCPNCKGAI